MKDDTDKIFGKAYFDGGRDDLGVFKTYRLEDLYPDFSFVATWVKKYVNPERVLDVGCAKGFQVKAFKDIGIKAWGVDVSKYAISSAPDDIRPTLYNVDLNKDILPFEDECFDFVTFLGTIEYLDNHTHIINEVKRVLRGGGGYLPDNDLQEGSKR